MSNFEQYMSPFSWRYASVEMRSIWSEKNKRRMWRSIWVSLAEVEAKFGLVTQDQLEDLQLHKDEIDIQRALEIEQVIKHDLMSEVKTFAEKCPVGGGIIHLGATSMDIEDNADALRLANSMDLILQKSKALLLVLASKIELWSHLPVMAFTHIQPAEPTTLGYRFSMYAQDLLQDYKDLYRIRCEIKGKGFKGAVGTAASYIELLGYENYIQFESELSKKLDLNFFPVTTQTYPRKQDFLIMCGLSGLAATLYKLAFDIRILQSAPLGEVGEPFGAHQVGSSAMPFKRNPIVSEKIDSLARLISQMPNIAWNNAAHSILERTLDDSANRRSILPESFLICDELLISARKICEGLDVNLETIERNMRQYAPFAATERLMMALVKAGANRQNMHEKIREHSMQAWTAVQSGTANPLLNLMITDNEFLAYLTSNEIEESMSVTGYTGIAEDRAQELANTIREFFSNK